MKTKDNRGITLITLIITIVLMLILVSVTAYTGVNTYRYSQVRKFVTQMQLIQTKVDDLVNTKTIDEIQTIGQDISVIVNATTILNNAHSNEEIFTTDTNTNIFRYFSEQTILEELDIEEVKNGIIINFTTREIISVSGIGYEGKTYYTQYKLPGGQTIINNTGTVTRDLTFELTEVIDGLNATIIINDLKITNGTLSYREKDNNHWITITNYTQSKDYYNLAITKTSTYEFKLTDNATGENSNEKIIDQTTGKIVESVPEVNRKKILLTNKPKTTGEIQTYNYSLGSDNWSYVTNTEGNNYVWIPRFAYDINNNENIKFIKGNSNIATDNTYVDDSWKIHDKFTSEDGIKLTGIWVSVRKDEVNLDGKNMLTLLNDNTRTLLAEI